MTHDSDKDPLDANLALLRQGLELLARLSDAAYRDAAPDRSSVGAQYRHVLDHYRALLDGVAIGRIDYDARRRDPAVETERDAAARDTRAIIDRFATLTSLDPATPVTVIASCSADHPGEPQPSSLGRELHFLVSHTVHHYAIVRLLLDTPGAVGHEFGVAPSTLAWQRTAG